MVETALKPEWWSRAVASSTASDPPPAMRAPSSAACRWIPVRLGEDSREEMADHEGTADAAAVADKVRVGLGPPG